MSHISEPTVRRLSNYYRVLEEVASEGKRMISSHLLAEREGITSAQVRKDLSSFGSFGRRGMGYHVEHLRDEIRTLLGLDRRWKACLVGAGHIGSALVGTFLGILLAYGFVEPLGGLLEQKVEDGSKELQCIKTTLLASMQGYAPQVAVEFGRKVLYSGDRPTFSELEGHVKGKK